MAKEHYETAAKLGHLLALARLANIYDTDRNLDSVIAYGDALSLEQWSHPMEHEAEEARRIMGLTPQAAISCLLRHAWHPQAGFDLEVLYYLAQRCIGDRNVDEEITRSVCLFTLALLTPAAEKNDARCAYYLARLNQAWEKKYPPAQICEVWDKLTEKRRKEMERAINQAKENALHEARERQKNAQLEAYKKQLEARERVLNLTLRDAYLDDDAAQIAGLMSTDELMIGKILKEDKLEKYKKELDKE